MAARAALALSLFETAAPGEHVTRPPRKRSPARRRTGAKAAIHSRRSELGGREARDRSSSVGDWSTVGSQGAPISSRIPVRRETWGARGSGADSKRRHQPIKRHDQHVVLDALQAPRADDAQDRQRARAAPAPTVAAKPCRHLAGLGEVGTLKGSRLGFDHASDSGGCDCDAVDVAVSSIRQRMAKSPPLCLERGQGCANGVLGAGADAAAAREAEPAARL